MKALVMQTRVVCKGHLGCGVTRTGLALTALREHSEGKNSDSSKAGRCRRGEAKTRLGWKGDCNSFPQQDKVRQRQRENWKKYRNSQRPGDNSTARCRRIQNVKETGSSSKQGCSQLISWHCINLFTRSYIWEVLMHYFVVDLSRNTKPT